MATKKDDVLKVLVSLLENVRNLDNVAYDYLIAVTELNSISFLSLNERQIETWINIIKKR